MNFSDSDRTAGLRIDDLTMSVAGRCLLDGVNVQFNPGELAVIVGPSGAGKSVWLRVVAGLVQEHDDVIQYSGRVLVDDPHESVAATIGVVFQSFALLDELSPIDNVQLAIDHRSNRHLPPRRTARQWLSELGVPRDVPTSALSGGQQQRLAIARTLALQPDLILYDEPTSGLDAVSGRKVARLIQATHRQYGVTGIVVTHDYACLIPVADSVWMFDTDAKSLDRVARERWPNIEEELTTPDSQSIDQDPTEHRGSGQRSRAISLRGLWKGIDGFSIQTGQTLIAAIRLPWDLRGLLPLSKWRIRFFLHYLKLSAGPSAFIYLGVTGAIIGFVTTYFTFRFLPYRAYTQPLLIDDLVASIGFALYRVLIPIMATVLIAARTGASVSADVGIRQYRQQVDAMRTLSMNPLHYLLSPMAAALLITTPALVLVAYMAARVMATLTFAASHPSIEPMFFESNFTRGLSGWNPLLWSLGKSLACGVGVAAIAYHRGMRPKRSAAAVGDSITSTILATTLYVLTVHFVASFLEF